MPQVRGRARLHLAGIGRVEVLHRLFDEVVIPARVCAELIAGPDGPALVEPWMRVEIVLDRELATRLEEEVDAGEAEAIAVAIQVGAELLLIEGAWAERSPSVMVFERRVWSASSWKKRSQG